MNSYSLNVHAIEKTLWRLSSYSQRRTHVGCASFLGASAVELLSTLSAVLSPWDLPLRLLGGGAHAARRRGDVRADVVDSVAPTRRNVVPLRAQHPARRTIRIGRQRCFDSWGGAKETIKALLMITTKNCSSKNHKMIKSFSVCLDRQLGFIHAGLLPDFVGLALVFNGRFIYLSKIVFYMLTSKLNQASLEPIQLLEGESLVVSRISVIGLVKVVD